MHNHFPIWSRDGRFIYFVKGTPTTDTDIWRIPAGGGHPEQITFHHAWVSYPAWLDARTLIYTATADDGSGRWIYAIDVEHRIPHRVSSGIAEQYLSVAVDQVRPHHLLATVANPTAALWTVPITNDMQPESAITPIQAANTRALSPRYGGHYLAFLSSKGGADGLWTLDSTGTAVELWKGGDGGVVAPPAISPNGNRLCFSYRKHGHAELFVINANGTGLTTLATSIDVQSAASWSPDGNWVAVAANQGDGTRVFKIPLDGGPPVRLRDTLSFNPVWSPDNRFIVYSEQRESGSFEVETMTPEGAPVALPAVASLRSRLPIGFGTPYRFMPDGKALITLQGVAPNQNFFRLDLETGEQRQLTSFDHEKWLDDSELRHLARRPANRVRSTAKSRRHRIDESDAVERLSKKVFTPPRRKLLARRQYYSCHTAIIGSMRAARRAGTTHASAADPDENHGDDGDGSGVVGMEANDGQPRHRFVGYELRSRRSRSRSCAGADVPSRGSDP